MSVKLGEEDDSSILFHRVGVEPLDVKPPLGGVRDGFDVGGGGTTHMSPDDADLDRAWEENDAADESEAAGGAGGGG